MARWAGSDNYYACRTRRSVEGREAGVAKRVAMVGRWGQSSRPNVGFTIAAGGEGLEKSVVERR